MQPAADDGSERKAARGLAAELLGYLAEGTNDIFWVAEAPSGRLLHMGKTFERVWGQPIGDLATLRERWRAGIAPADRSLVDTKLQAFMSGGNSSYDCIYRVIRPDYSTCWVRDRAWRLTDGAGPHGQVVGLAEDVSKRQESVRRAELLAQINDTLRSLPDPGDVLAAAAEELGRFFEVGRAGFAHLLAGHRRLFVSHDWTDGLPSAEGVWTLDAAGAVAEALRAGRQVLLSGVRQDEADALPLPMIGTHPARAVAMVPIMRDEAPAVIVFLQDMRPRLWDKGAATVIEEVAERAWSIAERAQAHQAMRASEQRYRALARAGVSIVWHADSNGRLLQGAAAWSALTGQAEDAIAQLGWLASVHPMDRPRVREIWAGSLAEKRFFETLFRIRMKSGDYRWYRSRGVPVFAANGGLVEWIGTLTDVHDRHEARLAAADANLRLTMAIERGMVLTWRLDIAADEVVWPMAQNDRLGLTGSRTSMPLQEWLSFVHRDDRDRVTQAIGDAAGGRSARLDVAFRFFLPGGLVRSVQCHGAPVHDDDDHVVALAGVVQDVTERLEQEAALRREAAEANERLAAAERALAAAQADLARLGGLAPST